jgi:AcrR family transcriptional regulator
MARPADPERRVRTLSNAADYVLEHGLEGLSLRPLAAALGTSTRMLLYDFESKEKLLDEVLAEIRRREAGLLVDLQAGAADDAGETLAAIWEWVSADERVPFMRLFFETYVDAMTRSDSHAQGGRPMVTDWVDFLGAHWRPERLDPATATLFVAVVRGLLLDRLTTFDAERTDAALHKFTELLARDPGAGP